MASYDGTNKSSAGCAQHLPYWEINTPYTRELYNEAMAEASPEAVKFCNPDGYNGPEIEVDASTLTEDQWQARRADHLGGSDISAIFGANKFKTNLDLFYAKTGKQPIVPEEETSQSRLNKLWGHISEEYVDAWLSERYPYNDIITDTNMALAGITKPGLAKLGGQALCFMADPAVAAAAKQAGTVLAVGNAPTALLTIAEKIENGLRPALVIGVPVGFVNVVESKERLFAVCESHGVPAIVAMGRKGGSNVAAAICNALIYSAAEMLDPTARGWK